MKTFLKGRLLVATPQLLAPIFVKSVILMLEHSDEGAMGVVLNRMTEVTVASVSAQVFGVASDWQKPILLGGPVPGPLVAVHTEVGLADPDTAVIPGLFCTSDAEVLTAIIERQAEPTRVVANYAGWSPGQLEDELERGSWVSLPARTAHVFAHDLDELWETVSREANGRKLADLFGLDGLPDDPRVN